MAWTDSRMFTQFVLNPLARAGSVPTGYDGLTTDVVKAALFNNDVVPDRNAVVGSTGYNTGTWVVADEVTEADWPAGGIALANDTMTAGSGFVMYDADDTTHANTVTLSGVFGALVYDDDISAGTVADQGICFNYFGGSQSVTGGTFTIVWHANGVFRITT